MTGRRQEHIIVFEEVLYSCVNRWLILFLGPLERQLEFNLHRAHAAYIHNPGLGSNLSQSQQNLPPHLLHVDLEGILIGVMLDYVVVHVNQDPS